ncbi:hypothetical protein ACWCQE_26840 [Streptomyces sp. NPDC002409]
MPEMMRTPAEAWLAEADPDTRHADRWLQAARILLLPLGRRWSVVQTTEYDGLTAAAVVPGPKIHVPGGCVYFLVPVDTDWRTSGTDILGDGSWLAVPVPTVLEPPGPYWLSPPDGSGQLVDPSRLRSALGPRLSVEHFV